MRKGDIRIELPKPFKVKKSTIHNADMTSKLSYYEVNNMLGVITNEGSIDKRYIETRCTDRNNLYQAGFKAGVEALVKVLDKPRRR